MLKKLFFVALVVLLYGCGVRQPKEYADYSDRSGFVVKNVDSVKVDNLVVLGKVWGFAKYHHPVFADSIYNIDYELFELLPKVAYADKGERNAILFDWVNGLGKFKVAEKKYLKEIAEKDYVLAADLKWLRDEEMLGAELSRRLQELHYAERTKPSRYAFYNTKTFLFDMNAESEKGPFFSDSGYDLLTLFRLWNMAEYYFPSVNITNKKWSEVLPEYVPKFLRSDSVEWKTAGLIAELSDTHSYMWGNPVYSNRKLPAELGFVEGKLIVTDNRKILSGNEEPMFESGDEIISIEGHKPEYFVERARKYIAASNENALLRDAAGLAADVSGEMVSVVIKREGKNMTFDVATITRQEYYNRQNEWVKGKTYYELLSDSVGYLYPGKFNNGDSAIIMAEFKDTKAIIVDMRCYPSDAMPFALTGGYFVPDSVQHIIWTVQVAGLPGYYFEFPQSLGHKNDEYYKGKVIVLVNEQTQSSAEYQTMAFQAAPNTIVIGSQTAGADGNIVMITLPRDIRTTFSGLGVFYPDGTNTQRAGIRIDHYVEPTIEGIKAGRDEVLEKALEVIESELSKNTEVPENL